MAVPIDFVGPINMNGLEIQNVTMQVLGADPGSPVTAQFWYNSASGHGFLRTAAGTVRVDNLTAAEILTAVLTVDGTGTGLDADLLDGSHGTTYLARANHTGTQTASTISDFDTQVRTSRLDQMANPTAAVSLNSQKITNLTAGSNPADAVNFAQLEAARQGVRSKAPVDAASTGNVTVSNPGTAVFDGVTVASGESVLLRAQTTPTENGIYVFNGSSSAMTRRDDADVYTEIDGGTETFVQGGSTYGGKLMRQLTELTSFASQDWQIIGAGTTYTAGDGLTESPAGTFNVVGTAGRIVANANDIDLASGVATPGTYTSVTVDTYGRVTGGTNPGFLKKYAANIGDGSTNPITITNATHALGATEDLDVKVTNATTKDRVYVNVSVATNGTVTITFAVTPTTNQYRVMIYG